MSNEVSVQPFGDSQEAAIAVAWQEICFVWEDKQLLCDAPEDLLRGLNTPTFPRPLGIKGVPCEEVVAR